ncbi:MAG: class I SAM-dependent methyltransferase [Deltaproteobacteria bacterium]|nr:class I SAM-dependent methyltransferase [Deltaproteobacteria bacterium]
MPELARCIVCEGGEASPFALVDQKSLSRCARCGLIFAHPLPAAKATEAFYEADYYDPYLEAERTNAGCYEAWLDAIEKRTARGELLDVGCGIGQFLEAARARGWRVEGVEPSPWPAAFARETRQLPVRTATLESAAFLANRFDVVTLWSTVEHLPDPLAVLREATRVLRPGGSLWLAVPNTRSLAVKLQGLREANLAKPEHLFHFSADNLTRLLCGRVGLEAVERIYLWGDRTGFVSNAVRHLARRTRLTTEIRMVGRKPATTAGDS